MGNLRPYTFKDSPPWEKANISRFGTGALHVPRLDTGREGAKGQGLPTGFPLDRRTRQLDVGDGPLLLRVAPQRKGHGATAENLILPLSGEDVLEFEVTQKCLRFGEEFQRAHHR